jgi:hypothetical protein
MSIFFIRVKKPLHYAKNLYEDQSAPNEFNNANLIPMQNTKTPLKATSFSFMKKDLDVITLFQSTVL